VRIEMLWWYLAVQLCGLAVLPLALRLFVRLPSRGYALSKVLGLLAVSYALWLLGMLGYLEYRRSTILVVLALLALVCWWHSAERSVRWLRGRWRQALWLEALLLTAFLVGGFVRAFNHDIIGQEKFMDLAFFNGFLATDRLPAEDPWLAGYGMAYYPFGYLLLTVPSKLAGLPASYGYNLSLVLVFALTVALTAELVANLAALLAAPDERAAARPPGARAWGFGLLGALFVAVCGNLVGPLEVLAARGFGSPEFWSAVGVKNLTAASEPTGWLPRDAGWWWHASRVIPTIQPDGITEFPYFSFLLGDLHPHYTALPLLLLIAALALALVRAGRPRTDPRVLLPTALALGTPLAANTWDAATFWALYGLAALAVSRRAARLGQGPPGRLLAWGLLPIPVGAALMAPYFVGYASQRLGLGLVPDRTPLVSLLLIFGPVLLIVGLLAWRLLEPGPANPAPPGRPLLLAALGGPAVLALVGRPTAALSLALLLVVAAAAVGQYRAWLAPNAPPAVAAALCLLGLAALGLGVLVAVEFVYLSDAFGTRMNTVFKFYYHVWLLLALAAAAGLAVLLRRSAGGSAERLWRAAGATLLAAGLLLGLVYPVGATWSKSNGFRGQPSLDGAAFLARQYPTDAAAIRWLAGQPGRPTVLEAVGGSYQEYGRVSTFTGLPTVLGWPGHESQWRGPLPELGQREQDVERVYRQADREQALQILERYGVDFVFVGSLEREKYGRSVDRLSDWLSPVFRLDQTVVFAVPAGADAS
jgi:YYY domain-containing protein